MLPNGFIFLQRDWLSSNSLLLKHEGSSYLFDSGYVTHADQLVQLLSNQLGDRPLDVLINTHLHSDHCGGNAILQNSYLDLQILVPSTQFTQVNAWDEDALTFQLTGQLCPRFHATGSIVQGTTFSIHGLPWTAYASKGHDDDSLIYFQPDHGILISADALWENGFSVVFPEFLGGHGFEEVSKTYDLIESLRPKIVVPGHGAIFNDVHKALSLSRQRLEYFANSPSSHATYAAKVLIKFKLMELTQCSMDSFLIWCFDSSLLKTIHLQYFDSISFTNWTSELIAALVAKKALSVRNGVISSY